MLVIIVVRDGLNGVTPNQVPVIFSHKTHTMWKGTGKKMKLRIRRIKVWHSKPPPHPKARVIRKKKNQVKKKTQVQTMKMKRCLFLCFILESSWRIKFVVQEGENLVQREKNKEYVTIMGARIILLLKCSQNNEDMKESKEDKDGKIWHSRRRRRNAILIVLKIRCDISLPRQCMVSLVMGWR